MERIDFLVVGAGISGLSFATHVRHLAQQRGASAPSVIVLEQDEEPGGYCKTIEQDGFVWDYSGHFFHFKHPEIEQWLRDRMPGQDVRTVEKKTFIRYAGRDIDFPFQKNIHQLPQDDFIDCLYELFFRPEGQAPDSFKDMLVQKFGRGICERFLFPYNEKLYATDLDALDQHAMGRFFPFAEPLDIVRNMKRPDNASYNQTFTYPAGGAIQYVHAFLRELDDDTVSLGERLLSVDADRKIATTTKREIEYRALITSAPFPQVVRGAGLAHDPADFSSNKVLVFNLGFDKKGPAGVHWMYFPDRNRRFYRVGWYDNIMGTDRMSLYVEIGARTDEELDVDLERARVLIDLEAEGIVDGHELLSHHTVTLDPAYVHITARSIAEVKRLKSALEAAGIYPVGRYGGWTYCAIEDNIVETRALAERLAPA